MTTDYFVKCPQLSCDWFGPLPANLDRDYWHGASMNVSIVEFQCPRCYQVWRARLIGNDLNMLPLEAEDDDLAPSGLDVDLGVGD